MTALQALSTQASQAQRTAAGATRTSMNIINTRRALKKATNRTAVPIQVPLKDTSSHHESIVASERTTQVRTKESMLVYLT